MKKLLELEQKLRKAREELQKFGLGGTTTSGQEGGVSQGGTTPAPAGTSIADQIGFGKKEHEDKKEDKKQIQKEIDKHNEKEHGEAKDKDSAMKKDYNEIVKFEKNGQWSVQKADQMDAKPDGKYDVPVKEVYDGDDKFKERGGKSVDGDKGKTIKVADKEKKDLKEF